MRRLVLTVLASVVVAGVCWIQFGRSATTASSPPAVPTASPPATSPADQPDEIFRRVFWKRPAEGDRILHSERREEKLEDGRSKWRSFLEVEASPALLDYLVKENAFGMRRLAAAAPVAEAPVWFVIETSTHDALATPQGSMRVFLAKGGNRLLVVSDATSFSAPASLPPKPAAVSEELPAGRLPASSPPGTR